MYLSLLGDGISSHGTKYMENPDFELNFIILDIKSNNIVTKYGYKIYSNIAFRMCMDYSAHG